MTGRQTPNDRRTEDLAQQDLATDNNRKFQLSRRRLLKLMGATAAVGATARITSKIVAKAAESPPGSTSADSSEAQQGNQPPSQRLRRWMMVIDLRKCDGCQSIGKPPRCTAGCIEAHYLPEPMEWIQVFEQELPGGGTQFIPTPCQACQNPPCVNVCPVGATWSTPEGVVLIDQQRCIGCRSCMAACPYDRRFFNWGNPPIPPEALFIEYHPERQTPLTKGVTSKCDFCVDMARGGRLPNCAQSCPNSAIYYGDFEEDIASNGVEVVELTKFLSENNAYRLKEELNTKPRVHYIPGHGEHVGRDSSTKGRLSSEWPWTETVKGAEKWDRKGHRE